MPNSKFSKRPKPDSSDAHAVKLEYGRVFAPVLHGLRLSAETVAVVNGSAPTADLDPRGLLVSVVPGTVRNLRPTRGKT